MNREHLEEAWELVRCGWPVKAAADRLGVSNATLARHIARLRENGGDIAAAMEGKRPGRPVVFEPDEFEVARARWFRLNKESLTVAAWFFARDEYVSPEGHAVRPHIRRAILEIEERALREGKKEAWPDSVRRAFRVTAEERALFRGRKAFQGEEMVIRRGMYETLVDGTTRELPPGDTIEMDDYSTNQPYVWRDPETGEMLLGRQVLAARELTCAKWLAFDMIGRERDAYRGEDILRFIEKVVLEFGVPKRLRLERGIWESAYIHGVEVEGMARPWGGLGDLMTIEHVFKSRSKSIVEGGFNGLQRWLSHTGIDIGRHRGEFEEATKRFLQAKAGGKDPLSLGFLSQDAALCAHIAAAGVINSRPIERHHLGERVSPDDLEARHGWHTRPLRAEEMWYFLPYKAVRTVRAGTVEIAPGNGWGRMCFAVNGQRDGVHVENGHQVLIACDPARPDLGARICNADRSARNREGWGMGQLLVDSAAHLPLAPQFSAAKALSPHLPIQKKARAAAVTAFASIRTAGGLPRRGGGREAVATDGRGNTAAASTLQRPEVAIQHGPMPDILPPLPRRDTGEIIPATNSRPLPPGRTRAEEIARLRAALEEA